MLRRFRFFFKTLLGVIIIVLHESTTYKRELHIRPPEGKSAAPEGPDGVIQGSRGSPVWMRDMEHPEGPLHQAPDNIL